MYVQKHAEGTDNELALRAVQMLAVLDQFVQEQKKNDSSFVADAMLNSVREFVSST